MKRYLVSLALALIASAACAESTIPDPETWYRDGYAPLWADKPGEFIPEMLTYYSDTVETHSSDGGIRRDSKREWLAIPLQQWLSEGWVGADLKQLRTDRINAATTSFKASWVDRYADQPEEKSCGWYLADLVDGRWQFTAYADIDCAQHDL